MADDIQIVSEEIEISALENRINNAASDDLFVDIRSLQEFEQGHIKGFKNCPLDDLKDNLIAFEGKTVILASHNQGVSVEKAVDIIHGTEKEKSILILAGGIEAWSHAQKSLVVGNEPLQANNPGGEVKEGASNAFGAVSGGLNKINPFAKKEESEAKTGEDSKPEAPQEEQKTENTESNETQNEVKKEEPQPEANDQEAEKTTEKPAEEPKKETEPKPAPKTEETEPKSETDQATQKEEKPKGFWNKTKHKLGNSKKGFVDAGPQRQIYIVLGLFLIIGMALPGSIFIGKIIIFAIAIMLLFIGVTGKMLFTHLMERMPWNK